MKYFVRIAATVIVVLLFVNVAQHIKLNYFEEVASPLNKKVPVAGTWKINGYKAYDGNAENVNALKQMVGKDAVFSSEYASVADISCDSPQYSVKSVNTERYMAFSKNVSIETGITNSISEVISVSSGENHFFDMIIIDDKRLAVLMTGGIVFLDKKSDRIEDVKKVTDNTNTPAETSQEIKEAGKSKSGVLLGIKTSFSPVENGTSMPSYKYRTIWIGLQNNSLMPVKEVEDLLVPRITGFWKLDMERVNVNGSVNDKIISYPLDNLKKGIMPGNFDSNNTNLVQNITFVGNDFLSLEYGIAGDNKATLSNLKIVPLSTPEQGKIKLNEIFGENAKNTFINSAKTYLQSINISSDVLQTPVLSEDNIAMFRKNGHWILKGRMNIESLSLKNNLMDFSISLIPEKKLVNYDKLTISWKDVKSTAPDAIDVFESPNSDFAIIVTKNNLGIYEIKNNVLSNYAKAKIKIDERDTVIMSEWATGDYTDKWDRAAASQGKVVN